MAESKLSKLKRGLEGISLRKDITKIKIILCALWDNQSHPEAQKIIKQFKEEIKAGN